MKVLVCPDIGVGKEIQDFIRTRLEIPEHATSFEIRFAVDELVTVKCEFFPAPKRVESV